MENENHFSPLAFDIYPMLAAFIKEVSGEKDSRILADSNFHECFKETSVRWDVPDFIDGKNVTFQLSEIGGDNNGFTHGFNQQLQSTLGSEQYMTIIPYLQNGNFGTNHLLPVALLGGTWDEFKDIVEKYNGDTTYPDWVHYVNENIKKDNFQRNTYMPSIKSGLVDAMQNCLNQKVQKENNSDINRLKMADNGDGEDVFHEARETPMSDPPKRFLTEAPKRDATQTPTDVATKATQERLEMLAKQSIAEADVKIKTTQAEMATMAENLADAQEKVKALETAQQLTTKAHSEAIAAAKETARVEVENIKSKMVSLSEENAAANAQKAKAIQSQNEMEEVLSLAKQKAEDDAKKQNALKEEMEKIQQKAKAELEKKEQAIKKLELENPSLWTRYRWLIVAGIVITLIVIGLLIWYIVIQSRESTLKTEVVTAVQTETERSKEDKKQMFTLGWEKDGAAAVQFKALQREIGQDPTYWTRGKGGYALWDYCNLRYTNPAARVTEGGKPVSRPDTDPMHFLNFIYQLRVNDRADGDVVELSIVYALAETERPFVMALTNRLRHGATEDRDSEIVFQKEVLRASGQTIDHALFTLVWAMRIASDEMDLNQAYDETDGYAAQYSKVDTMRDAIRKEFVEKMSGYDRNTLTVDESGNLTIDTVCKTRNVLPPWNRV